MNILLDTFSIAMIIAVCVCAVIAIICLIIKHVNPTVENSDDEDRMHKEEKILYGFVYDKFCDNCGQFTISKYDGCYHCTHCGKTFTEAQYQALMQRKDGVVITKPYPNEVIERERNKEIFTKEYRKEFESLVGISLDKYFEEINEKSVDISGCHSHSNTDATAEHINLFIYKDFIFVDVKNNRYNGEEFKKVSDPLAYAKIHFRKKSILKYCVLKGPMSEVSGFYKESMFKFDDPQDGLTYIKPKYANVDENNKFVLEGLIKDELVVNKKVFDEFENHYGITFDELKSKVLYSDIGVCRAITEPKNTENLLIVYLYKGTQAFAIYDDAHREEYESLVRKDEPDMDKLKKFLFSEKDIMRVNLTSETRQDYDRSKKAGILDYALADAAAGDAGILATAIASEHDTHPVRTNYFLYVYLDPNKFDKQGIVMSDYDTGFGNTDHLKPVWQFFESFKGVERQPKVETNIRSTEVPAEELRKLKSLLDDGIISQEEFDAKKKELLGL